METLAATVLIVLGIVILGVLGWVLYHCISWVWLWIVHTAKREVPWWECKHERQRKWFGRQCKDCGWVFLFHGSKFIDPSCKCNDCIESRKN